MYDQIIEKILEYLDESLLTSTYPSVSGQDYGAHKIDAKNFHKIKKTNSGKKIAFIDGGNAEIIGSANFSLNLIRLGYVVHKNNNKIISKKFEILAFTHITIEKNEIYYKTSFFKTKNAFELNEINFSSFDHTLMVGINRAEVSSVANAVRRFAELRLAKIISDQKIADIIVIDGNLQSTVTNEKKYMEELYESCLKNNVILTALSKTTTLFTDNGKLLSVVLNKISPFSSWYYHPIFDIKSINHKAEMFFAKFHSRSKHIFRFEIFNIQGKISEEAINELAGNCLDPIFIGYPYGLMEADRIARISNQERESLKTIFQIKIKEKNLGDYLNLVNAHEILDKISF